MASAGPSGTGFGLNVGVTFAVGVTFGVGVGVRVGVAVGFGVGVAACFVSPPHAVDAQRPTLAVRASDSAVEYVSLR